MADTLINVNQNQLNTQNGSFTELIKSTQQGKEKLATALVDKGANVSSSSTLSDMAVAAGNIKALGGLDTITGTAVSGSSSTYAGYYLGGAYKVNEKGLFYITQTYNTSRNIIRIFNLSPELYVDNSNSAYFKDFTVPVLTNNTYNYNQCLYVSHDGKTIYYVGNDIQTVYKCTVDYSGVSATTPTNITLTQDSYVASEPFHTSYASKVVAVNDETHDIIIWQPNNASLSAPSGTFKKFNTLTLTTTNMTHDLSSTSNAVWIGSLSTNTVLYNSYINNSPICLLKILNIDYQNNSVTQAVPINIVTTSSSYSYTYGSIMCEYPVASINNTQYMCIVVPFFDKSYLLLININNSTYKIYSGSSKYFIGTTGTNNGALTPGYPTTIGDTVYIAGGVCGEVWKITVVNNELNVETDKLLLCTNNSSSLDVDDISGVCVYGQRTDGTEVCIHFYCGGSSNGSGSAASQYRITNVLHRNSLIGYTYANGTGSTVTLLPRIAEVPNLLTGALDLPEADVLVEDN